MFQKGRSLRHNAPGVSTPYMSARKSRQSTSTSLKLIQTKRIRKYNELEGQAAFCSLGSFSIFFLSLSFPQNAPENENFSFELTTGKCTKWKEQQTWPAYPGSNWRSARQPRIGSPRLRLRCQRPIPAGTASSRGPSPGAADCAANLQQYQYKKFYPGQCACHVTSTSDTPCQKGNSAQTNTRSIISVFLALWMSHNQPVSFHNQTSFKMNIFSEWNLSFWNPISKQR